MTRLRDLGADGLCISADDRRVGLSRWYRVRDEAAVGIIAVLGAAKKEKPEEAWIDAPFLAIGIVLAYLLVRSFTRAPFFNARGAAPRALRRTRAERGGEPQRRGAVRGDARASNHHVLQPRRFGFAPATTWCSWNVVTHDGNRVHVTSSPDSGSL